MTPHAYNPALTQMDEDGFNLGRRPGTSSRHSVDLQARLVCLDAARVAEPPCHPFKIYVCCCVILQLQALLPETDDESCFWYAYKTKAPPPRTTTSKPARHSPTNITP
ncbi:hypothetical protein ColTof3_14741 [Colletotrichum tofieldiae]|nr:hypothetical protein ColTof3_14741 [Colletotrichum tofieldiae]